MKSSSLNGSTTSLNSLINDNPSPNGSMGGAKLNKAAANESEHFTQDLAKYFNLKNSKYVACFLIFMFIFYHGYLNSFYGRNSCNRLLGEGHIKGDNEWQPSGCMIHKYSESDIETCFKYVKYFNGKNNFVFIGDSRIRQVYTSFINQFDKVYKYEIDTTKQPTLLASTTKISNTNSSIYDEFNLNYTNKVLNLEVSFIYRPFIDESLNNLFETLLVPSSNKHGFILIGTATSYLKSNQTKDSFEWFKGNLTNLVDLIKSLSYDFKYAAPNKSTSVRKIIPTNENPNENKANPSNNYANSGLSSVYWMLQDPVDEYKYSFNKSLHEHITNKQIDMYNRAALDLLYHSPVGVWSSSRLVSQAYNKDSGDGLEMGRFALDIDSQILFNLYCNNRMNFNDASCCSQPESVSIIQQIIFSIFIFCFVITGALFFYKNFSKTYSKFRLNISGSEISLTATCKNAAASNGFYTIIKCLSKLALIMLYFYACDRANYFMKENRHFTYLTFLIPLTYVSVLGIFFQDSLPMEKVMNRHQTDELKGFMQIFILLYRMSVSEKSTSLYLIVRLFTSSYLFLSGYGHFMYYWNTSNYSISRFFEVLFRTNFLLIMLCFTMNRMYQFYSFIPLVTLWFICSYILMVVYPRVSAKTAKDNPYAYIYMIIKLSIFAGLIVSFDVSETFFEKVFLARPWKFLFVSSDDLISDWRKRWSNDCYSFLFGMVFALIICILKRVSLIEEFETNLDYDNTETREKRHRERALPFHLKFISILISLAGLIAYFVFAVLCRSKENCDNVTKYITVIPIVSYFILRNTFEFLSNRCSFMFSWFGRISLELYICSYHIWLAADSNGILVLLPAYPVLNMLITTFIFICIAHELNLVTKLVGQYVVPNNWRTCLRNFLCFVILLMPIAIKYGYI